MHMTCLRCGKVQEFESDLFDRVKGQVERLPLPHFGGPLRNRRVLRGVPEVADATSLAPELWVPYDPCSLTIDNEFL
jgi:hypothetical protein